MRKLLFIPFVAAVAACNSTRPADAVPAVSQSASSMTGYHALPRAVVYKTNVPCYDNVAISLNATRSSVLSYPAPSDVSAASAPLQLPDGWLLDRRGLGPNPAFISLTYKEYSALKTPPSPDELMKMVLPDVYVTDLMRLDRTPQQAEADTALVVKIISDTTILK